MSKVIVTGAGGFVGRALCENLISSGYEVVGTSRSTVNELDAAGIKTITTGDISADLDWRPVLGGAESVVHLAARVHVMCEEAEDPLAEFRKVNVDGTERLIRACGAQGVKRFIYLSTAKVCGERTLHDPFDALGNRAPEDPYARSKSEAENIVQTIGMELGVETVIIRPPLVYGPSVGGNFLRLMKLVRKGVPLPFASIDNLRSLVGVSNLCDLIRECLGNKSAAGEVFMVTDDNDLSTPELVCHIASAMNRRPRLLPCQTSALRWLATLLGRSAEASRLIDSFQIDISRTMEVLGWRPPISVSDEICSTVNWYEKRERRAGN